MTFRIPPRLAVHSRYFCAECGEDVRFVIAWMPGHLLQGHQKGGVGAWCGGTLERYARVFVPRHPKEPAP